MKMQIAVGSFVLCVFVRFHTGMAFTLGSVVDHHKPLKHTGVGWFLVIRNGELENSAKGAQRFRRNVDQMRPEITKLNVVSQISSRFAQTVLTSDLKNTEDINKEAIFEMQIPKTAFISNFTMKIDGKIFIAEVKSKVQAEKDYQKAISENKTAGKVSAEQLDLHYMDHKDLDKEWFRVAVNVKANSTVQFVLTYQELLRRRLGLYEHSVFIYPKQPVEGLSVETYVYEPQGFLKFEVEEPGISTNDLSGGIMDTRIVEVSPQVREIFYRPSIERQKDIDTANGIIGNFVIKYDVNHAFDAGSIQFENNFFVHFFSPAGSQLTALPKNIIFVIDVSGSMSGKKIQQTLQAMITILDQLYYEDKFMLLLFHDNVEMWPSSKELSLASQSNIRRAKDFVTEKLKPQGGTNIYQALQQAVGILKVIGKVGANMVIFLTDGQATVGETRNSVIIDHVESASGGKVSIFSLGFGVGADYELLQALSYRTGGFPQQIYEEYDAKVQLENFFAEISTPLLYDINVVYPNDIVIVNSLTSTSFPQYFEGSEIVVAGKVRENLPQEWTCVVTGETDASVSLTKEVQDVLVVPPEASKAYTYGFLEKLYVYMKIKDLLMERYRHDSLQEIEEIENYAINLAIEYNLVTPLTSMILVQPDDPRPENELGDKFLATSYSGTGNKIHEAWLLAPALLLISFCFK